MIADAPARKQAIDITRSYIVQAPAGSGKTELLTQRYLALLAKIEKQPEQILAITFTRKAASEMRNRVNAWLQRAQNEAEPETAHEKQTWRLAKAVLERDKAEDWQLLNNPNRLTIQTIDALSASIAQQLPLLSRVQGSQIVDAPDDYYQEAALGFIEMCESEPALTPALQCVLLHMDNRLERLVNLFMAMLKQRDQWLPYCLQYDVSQMRAQLEETLAIINAQALQQLLNVTPSGFLERVKPLTHFAEAFLTDRTLINQLQGINDAEAMQALPFWQGMADWLLTSTGDARKTVTIKQGFPAKTKADNAADKQTFEQMKQDMMRLLKDLQNESAFVRALQGLRELPPLHYTDGQWSVLAALFELLPILAAQLQLVFRKHRVSDFIEVSMAALQALESEAVATDFALSIDYRLQHILVDEFQDTSISQWLLLERLLTGWDAGDGRSLFLVGDPMQSIYRFRQAEVGLFLRAKHHGIAGLDIIPLSLSANFRQADTLVAWNNEQLPKMFPRQAHVANGAIPYEQAQAIKIDANANLEAYGFLPEHEQAATHQLVSKIQSIRANNCQQSIAILVRSRSHLTALMPALLLADIPFQAVDIEPLSIKQSVIDCFSLTRALLHLSDRIAWLALLRAPWCGLSLSDLEIIAQDENALIWHRLEQPDVLNHLSEGSQVQIQRFVDSIRPYVQSYGRYKISERSYQAWLRIGGYACLIDEQQRAEVMQYFKFLRYQEAQNHNLSVQMLAQKLSHLFASNVQRDAGAVQIMTMHKAKGLEFDVVILPGLGKRMPYDDHQLLSWTHYANPENDLLMWLIAPIANQLTAENKIYTFIRKHHQLKANHELMRVLYVALTRAKQKTILFGAVKDTDKGLKAESGSFYQMLLPYLEDRLTLLSETVPMLDENIATQQSLFRLPPQWHNPFVVQANETIMQNNNSADPNAYRWQAAEQKQDGILLHRMMQFLSEYPGTISREGLVVKIDLLLKQYGFTTHNNIDRINRLVKMMEGIIKSATGQWLLQKHQDDHCEFSVEMVIDGRAKQLRIDRTFICDGIRWIIDYKRSQASATSESAQQQLDLYKNFFVRSAAHQTESIKTATFDLSSQELVITHDLSLDKAHSQV